MNMIDPAGYVSADGFPVPPQPMQGGGFWDGSGGGDCAGSGGVVAQGEAWAAVESMMLGGDVLAGNDLFMSDEVIKSLWESAMMNSQEANQAGAHTTNYGQPMVPADELNRPPSNTSGPTSLAGAADSPGMMSQMSTYPLTMDYPRPAEPNQQASGSPCTSTQFGVADAQGMMPQMPAHPPPMDYRQAASINIHQAVPDYEKAEVAQMVQTALRCDDKVSTEWSEEENQVLREGLSRFAGQDNVTKCFTIASMLAYKTVLDVAYRIRWLSDLEKKRGAKQAQLEQEKSAEAKVTTGKGTKGATRKNNKYPRSKEVLNSKSAKELIRDNDRLMDKIEENLRTGQVKDSPDYFYYMKMNMDALQNKVTDISTVLEGVSVDDEEWADVLKDRSSSV